MYTVKFFDDIDVAYLDRKKGNGKMACSMLTAMDGMREDENLVRIFTTNEPVEELDPAFPVRAGSTSASRWRSPPTNSDRSSWRPRGQRRSWRTSAWRS
jgi:hypothetical protein